MSPVLPRQAPDKVTEEGQGACGRRRRHWALSRGQEGYGPELPCPQGQNISVRTGRRLEPCSHEPRTARGHQGLDRPGRTLSWGLGKNSALWHLNFKLWPLVICCLSPSLQACVAGLICGGRGCRWPHSSDLPCIAGSLHVSEPHPSPCGGKSSEDVTPAVSVGACSQGGEGSWGEGERHRVCPAGWGRGQDRGSVLTLSLHPPPTSSLTLLPRRSDNQGPVLSAAHFPRWCTASGRCRRSVSPA